jgi:hypothetical protein
MHTVEIADDVYAALQRLAVPLEDTINDVLRRLVLSQPTNGNGNGQPKRPEPLPASSTVHDVGPVIVHRRSPGSDLPQSTFRTAVLGVFKSNPAPISIVELFGAVSDQLADRIGPEDRETLGSGITRWESKTRNALTQLQFEGTIELVHDGVYRYRNNGRTTTNTQRRSP